MEMVIEFINEDDTVYNRVNVKNMPFDDGPDIIKVDDDCYTFESIEYEGKDVIFLYKKATVFDYNYERESN